MDRISYIEVADKKYPLSLSLGATKEICNKYGSMEKMQENLKNNEDLYTLIDTLTYVLETVIRQGCKYVDFIKAYLPKDDKLAVDEEGHCVPLTQETLETIINMDNANYYINALLESMGKSTSTEIEVKEEKNAETPHQA